MSDPLSIWTIYHNPTDFPGKYVARRWIVSEQPAATGEVFLADTLGEVRDMLPPGLVPMQRWEGDDPCIVETWL